MYTKHVWHSETHFNFQYVQYLPKDYDPSKKYPLVFFLHGAGERGNDLDVAMRYGFMQHVREDGAEYPFIFLAPQCPHNKYWGCYTESLIAFLDEKTNELPIDTDRIYLTGLSMGGTGTWMLAMACPEKFAAIAPICGSGITWNAAILKHIPIMVYHGNRDGCVPIDESIHMIGAVNKNGGDAHIKVLFNTDHDAWFEAYKGDELWKWLLSHSLQDRNA